ncbi:MAG: 4Fe-4S dicluster domain-containing protein [Elusimicrobiota bacterium]
MGERLMRLPKLRELKEALKAVFSKRYTSRFPREKSPAAEGFRGKPIPDDKWCIGCEACMEACPSDAITIEDKIREKKRIIVRHYDRCNYCAQCEQKCPQPEPGVKLSPEYDFPSYSIQDMKAYQEFELIVCEKCSTPLGSRDQLLATAKRMGPALASSSPDMLIIRQKEIKKPLPPSSSRKEDTRADIFTFLCPVCRHEVYRKEAGN